MASLKSRTSSEVDIPGREIMSNNVGGNDVLDSREGLGDVEHSSGDVGHGGDVGDGDRKRAQNEFMRGAGLRLSTGISVGLASLAVLLGVVIAIRRGRG